MLIFKLSRALPRWSASAAAAAAAAMKGVGSFLEIRKFSISSDESWHPIIEANGGSGKSITSLFASLVLGSY